MRECIRVNASKFPDNIAVRDLNQQITWLELHETIEQMMSLLKSGTKLCCVIFVSPAIESVIALLALLSAGHDVLILNPAIESKTWNEVSRTVKPNVVVASREVLGKYNSNVLCVTFEDLLRTGLIPVEDVTVNSGASFPTKGSLIFMTSGTTSSAKFVCRSTDSLRAEGQSYVCTLNLTDKDVFLATLPLYHSYGCGATFLAALECGGQLVLPPMFYPTKVVKWIRGFSVTFLPLIPALVMSMLDMLEGTVSVPTLRFCMVGTGRISQVIIDRFREKFGIDLTGNYGSTETGAANIRLEKMTSDMDVGTPMRGVNITIRGGDGRQVPRGVNGRVFVKTSSLFTNYLNCDRETIWDGWWPIGDTGYIDELGKLHVTGRLSNVLQRNGKKYNVELVESVLMQLDEVEHAVLIGESHPMVENDSLVALIKVAPKMDVDETKLRKHLLSNLGKTFVLDEVLFVSDIPFTPNGKVRRFELASMLPQFRCVNQGTRI